MAVSLSVKRFSLQPPQNRCRNFNNIEHQPARLFWEQVRVWFSGGEMRVKGKVIKWQNEKGFGFIEPKSGGPKLFFHENFLINQSRRPIVSDEVSFEIATNPEGKKRAEKILFRGERDPRQLDRFFDVVCSVFSCIFLFSIGALVFFKKLDPVILILYLLLSLVTFLLYWQDKIKAKNDRRRTPEKTLHCFSLLGGWPGALIAQRTLHHKSRKKSFQIAYYITVVLNISVVSFYFLSGPNFLRHDLLLQNFNQLAHKFTQNYQDRPSIKQKGPVYSWINGNGKRVYSNVGFPSNEPYFDGKIEWQ